MALFCGRFEIIENHSGGMADVLICRDVRNHRIVAAKTPYFAPELFSREARMWLGLGQHPNIVRAHIVHTIDGMPFLFMDFVGDANHESQNLRQALAKTPDRGKLIVNAGLSVVRALRYARAVYPGFVHRDIKPENILIDKKETVYLTDFGIGHIPRTGFQESTNNRSFRYVTGKTCYTRTGGLIGTVGYASPEQYLDSSRLNYKADIYSLGVVLFEALHGKLPVDPQRIVDQGYKIINQPLDMHHRHHGCGDEIDKLIKEMLAFQPKNRPASLEDLEKEFDRHRSAYGQSNNGYRNSDVQQNTTASESVRLNRIYSFIELNEQELAIANIISLQKNHPFSQSCKTIIHKLFGKLPKTSGWEFIKSVAKTDFTNPKWLAGFVGSLLLMAGPFVFLEIKSFITAPFAISSVVILILLFFERYINARTSITLDKITLWGILAGYVFMVGMRFLNLQTPAGSFGRSCLGSVIGLGIPLAVAYIFRFKAGNDFVGGGTIKLSAMIGSWTGLLIIPILVTATLILLGQGGLLILIGRLPGELKWSANTLVPRLYKKVKFVVPTSTAFFCSTWFVLIVTGIKLGNGNFPGPISWLLDQFMPY